MARRWLATMVTLLAAQPALAWEQFRGGPEHAGVVEIEMDLLEVAGRAWIGGTQDEHDFSGTKDPGFYVVPSGYSDEGLFGVRGLDDSCRLVQYEEGDDLSSPEVVELGTLEGCVEGRAVGIVPGMNLLLVCSQGGPLDPILQAWDIGTRALRWATVPAAHLDVPVLDWVWSCHAGSFDAEHVPGSIYVPFVGRPRVPGSTLNDHRIAKIDLDSGEPPLHWVNMAVRQENFFGVRTTPRPDLIGQGFEPLSVTVTTSGLVWIGSLQCAGPCFGAPLPPIPPTTPQLPTDEEMAIAWTDDFGNVKGTLLAREGSYRFEDVGAASARSNAGSAWAVATGSQAVTYIGKRVVVIDPSQDAPVRQVAVFEEETPYPMPPSILHGPVAWERAVFFPFPDSVVSFEADAGRVNWVWRPPDSLYVEDLMVSPAGFLYVLLGRYMNLDEESWLRSPHVAVLGLRDGRIRQLLPIPYVEPVEGEPVHNSMPGGSAAFVPYTATEVLVYVAGTPDRLFPLRPPRERSGPILSQPKQYPATGEAITLDISARDTWISWGDGSVEFFAAVEGEAFWLPQHTYASPGSYEIVVSQLRDVVSSSTGRFVVQVGATPPLPPEKLNFMQRAFAPGNQDTTWGILGLLIAAGGGLFAYTRHHRRRSRLERELRTLESIRGQGLRDPLGAVRALEDYRGYLQQAVEAGRLDEHQISVLEPRMGRLFRALSRRLLAPFRLRVSLGYQSLLEMALEDGLVEPAEAEELKHRLGEERQLTRAERKQLVQVIEWWTVRANWTQAPVT